MKTKHLILGLFATAFTFTSCNEDEGVDFTPVVPGAYENGILVSNEGGFGAGNATVSFVSNDFTTVNNSIFEFHNNVPLGDTAQSMAFYNDLAYIVVNGSNKIEVVNKNTFVSVSTIDTGLTNPRYITFANGNGYVTNWGDGGDATDDFVAVIDLTTNTVTSTISVIEGPEQAVVANGKIYISHKGGWGSGASLSVIDATNTVTTIVVGEKPDEMVVDTMGNIWVISEGSDIYDASWNVTGHTAAFLQKINTSTDVVDVSLTFPADEHASTLAYDNGLIYYYSNSRIFKMDETATVLPTTQVIDETLYAGLAVKDGNIYGTKADFTAGTGELVIYDDSTYMLLDTKSLEVGSSKIYFN